jgi:hypothetical protein
MPSTSRLKRLVQRVSTWMFTLLEIAGLPLVPRAPGKKAGGEKP